MKRKSLIISVGVLLLSIMLFFTYKEIFKVQITQANNPNGLTSAQKETDFRYLTNLAVKGWPFVESNVKTKGLSDISALTEDYIQKAGKTKNDTEFMNLIEEYITHLRQTGHAYLLYEDPNALALAKSDKNIIKPMLSFYNIDESALNKINYWSEIDDKIVKTKYIQPEVKINYINGKYVVTESTKLRSSGTVLPKGTEIENIDGYPVDDYVKMQQTKARLSYDNYLHKLFLFNPLMINSQNSELGLKVSFRLPDNNIEDAVVSKSYYSNEITAYPNVITEELSKDTGYIKIFSFPDKGTVSTNDDKKLISDYIKKAQGKYKKLIIDIRGNGGGDPKYWQDLIVAPLIKEPIEYTQTAAVKKDFFKLWGKTVQEYLNTQYIDTQTPSFINKNNNPQLQKIDEIKNLPGYDDSWITFNMTHKISPEDRLPFDGKVYLLVDGNTFSASEDFAQFCKRTGFAEIVGNNTGGGAAELLAPHYFCLPESKIIFRLEVETVLNADGTMSEVLGTEPDIKMEIKPTPTSYNKESLMKDDWISRIINY